MDYLFGIKQQDGELNVSYMKRFDQVVVEVEDLNESITIKALTRGIAQSEKRFYNYIT